MNPQNFLIDSMSEADLDELIEMICAEAINVSPDSFNGESRCFKFNLRYCPPYEQDRFRELKRLQEVAQSNVRFKDEFKGFVALDITEWNGHFDEDLFKITLAFLSDMSDCWKYIFILSGYLKDNLDMLNKYFKIKHLRDLKVEKASRHTTFFDSLRKAFNIQFSPNAMKAFQKYIPQSVLKTKETTVALTRDINDYFGVGACIGSSMLLEYLSDIDSICFDIISDEHMTEIKMKKEESDHAK